MYHCILKIGILSKEPFLETKLRGIPPLEQFDHEFETLSDISDERLLDKDVLLIDLPLPDVSAFLQSKEHCKPSAVLVICADTETFPLLPAEILEGADYLWAKPYTDLYLSTLFNILLRNLKTAKDLQLTQIYLDSTIDSMPDLVWFKDLDGAHLKVNDAFCLAVGKTKEDIRGKGHCYIWDLNEEDYEKGDCACRETDDIVLRSQKTCQFNEKVQSKHGLRQFKTYKSPLFYEGRIIGTVGIGHDITDLQNMGAELEIILRSMPFAIVICDKNYEMINANDKFEKYFRTSKKHILGKDYNQWKQQIFQDSFGITAEGYQEAALTFETGKILLEIHEEAIYDVFGEVAGELCLFRDVTNEKQLEERILYNSNTDFLTGLYNRRYFYEYIATNRRGRPVSLIYIDLDHFKKVNDTYGHQAGDEALIATADLLKCCFPDTLTARLGGDEFIVAILGPCSEEYLKEKAGDLLDKMSSTFRASKYWKVLSASIGISQTKDPEMKIDSLLRQSDVALYKAKQNGRSQYCIFEAHK